MVGSISFKELEDQIDGFRKVLPKAVTIALQSAGRSFEKRMDRRFTATLQGPMKINTSTDRLANRTGALRRSIRHRVINANQKVGTQKVQVSIGNAQTAHYVFTQEHGATIRPKRAKWLTVPIDDNLTGAGNTRYERASLVPGGFLMVLPSGKAFIVSRATDGDLKFWFVLKKSVKIPARLGMASTWSSTPVRTENQQWVDRAIQRAAQRVGLI